MINKLLTALAAGVLLFFTARRWLFTGAALAGQRPVVPLVSLPSVLLLAPVRNEAAILPRFLAALAGLDYPSERLTVVLIDDGSTDDSQAIMQQWADRLSHWHVLALAPNRGKAEALNLALARFTQGEVVAIYDADEQPRSDALRRLVAPLADERVGGVSGRRAVSNALAGPAASYTAFEGLVHQLVTAQAKDRLNLAPPLLGSNCAYRRAALARVDYFKPGAFLEDSDLTVRLARTGWQTRFVAGAVSYHRAAESVSGYWQVHTRWARGFNEVAGDHSRAVLGDRRLSPMLRLELLAFSAGYLDRLALLLATGLIILNRAGRFLAWLVALSLVTPLAQIVVALKIGRAAPALWRRLGWVPLFFGLDIAMAVVAAWQTVLRSPHTWEERQARQ